MDINASDAWPEHHAILLRLIELSNRDPSRGISVAITSPNHDDGVSYVTNLLQTGLRLLSVPKVMSLKLSYLERARSADQILGVVTGTRESADSESDRHGDRASSSGPWNDGSESRKTLIRQLCTSAKIVLVDCPPLRQGNSTMIAAGVVDRVILVVQAGSSTREDILYAERRIQASGGHLEGYVLNKVRTRT